MAKNSSLECINRSSMNSNTDKVLELVRYGYTIMSVGGKTTKQPLNSSGYGLSEWETLPHSEIMKHINIKGKRFGLRTGKQGNDRYIASLDWDCCGKKGKDGRMGCDYTKQKLQKYNEIKTCDDGMFKGGTTGNYNMLFDFTDVPQLRKRFQQLIDDGKKKIELQSLEIFYSNGSQQVIPPSATLSKITGEEGESRQFLNNERPFIVLSEDTPETNYIIELLDEYDTIKKPVAKKPVAKKSVVRSISPCSTDEETEVVMTEYDDMILNGLGKKRLEMDEYLRLASVLKSNNVSVAIWNKWNTECCNVDDDHHTQLWDTCVVDKNLKMSFVEGMCKKHDQTYYKNWRMKQTSYKIDECVKDEQKLLWCDFNVKVPKRTCFTDVAFGDIFKLLYGDKFRFTNGFIYHFNGVYWERDNKQKSNTNCFIDDVFYQDLKKWILGKISYWTKKAGENEDDDKNNKGIAFWTRVNLSVKDYIKTQRSKAELIKAIESKVCNDSQEWDLNPYIFVFKNCVFDLRLGKKVEPNPLDFMATCCGWEYDDNYNDVGIEEWLKTIQQDKNVRDYLMKAYYSCMNGVQSRNVYILTGSGGNGKSVLDELLMSMLGGYGYALPKAFLTQPFKDGANPEAIALHNKRCVIVSEPDAKKNICCSSLKALSGDSKISSRKLYGDVESVKIIATSIIECNTPPNLDEMNDAISDRLGEGVINFNSKFVKQSVYDALSEDERVGKQIGNPYYSDDKFKVESRQSLFNYLLGFKDKDVKVPNSVRQSSKKYLAKSDIFYDWFCDNYEVDDDNKNVLKVKDIFYEFKNDNYDVVRNDKQTYGTRKNFIFLLRSNIFVRKYFKERDDYYNGEQLSTDCLVGWKQIETEDGKNIDIDCDSSTICD